MYYWIPASADFQGPVLRPRSGHSATVIGNTKVVIFGGLVEKKFLNDVLVLDIKNKQCWQPKCTGDHFDGQIGPFPRAFHIAVSIEDQMFIFGGRCDNRRLGDLWVLNTGNWKWSELTCSGDIPSSRDFAAASAFGNQKIVLYGGWDGKKFLSDIFILDTLLLMWRELTVTGSSPPPRCGHSATMIEKRLLVYGGRGGGGPILGDLWALKGLTKEENETPGWAQLKLPGQAPSPRCGHSVTPGGHNLLLFGGHGTGGWLSRYDIYYNECIILDRVCVQWRRLPIANTPPAARAYHSLVHVTSKYLLFGGFDGKSAFNDIWWLLSGDDPGAKKFAALPVIQNTPTLTDISAPSKKDGAILELQKKLELPISQSSSWVPILDEMQDKELLDLALALAGEKASDRRQAVQMVRDHWRQSDSRSIPFKELGPLLRDYQRQIYANFANRVPDSHLPKAYFEPGCHRFYHVKSSSQLRMDDITQLVEEYKRLV